MARFTAANIIPITSVPTYPAWSNASVLRFQAATFAGTLANIPWSYEFTYANNCNPNMALNGTSFPEEMNAGLPTSSFSIMTQSIDSDGYSTGSVTPVTAVIPDNTSQVFYIDNGFQHGGSQTRRLTVTLNNVINDTRDNRSVRVPRNMRLHNYIVTAVGGSSSYEQPFSYTSTF